MTTTATHPRPVLRQVNGQPVPLLPHPAVTVTDTDRLRFAYVIEDEVFMSRLGGLRADMEQAAYTGDAPWQQLYAVVGAALVPVEVVNLSHGDIDSDDIIHTEYAVVDMAATAAEAGVSYYFGRFTTRVDGRV